MKTDGNSVACGFHVNSITEGIYGKQGFRLEVFITTCIHTHFSARTKRSYTLSSLISLNILRIILKKKKKKKSNHNSFCTK